MIIRQPQSLYDAVIVGSGATGNASPWSGAPARPNGIYIPRFRNVTEKETNGFIRG
jgi:hypothetical protein